MKRIIASIVLLSISGLVFGQNSSIESFFDKYKDRRDITHVSLSGSIFKLASAVAEWGDEEDEELMAFADIADGIDHMEILNIDDYRDFFDNDEIEDLVDDMKKEGYEVLMTIREDRQLIRILSKQSKRSVLNDVTIIDRDGRDFSVITIDGSVRLSDINRVID